MSAERIRELWGRFLGGEELSADDQKALVEALDADPELRESLLENLQLDGMLQALNTTRRQGEGFVRNLTECLDVEHDGTRFVKKVELRLNEPPPPPATGAGTGRRSKPPTARALRRRSGGSSDDTAWKHALVAAGIFAAIFLVVLASTHPAPAPIVRERTRPERNIAPPDPVDPPAPPMPAPRTTETPKPRIEETPSTPLSPPRFPDPKPEERPTPAPVEEKRPESKEPRGIAAKTEVQPKEEPEINTTLVESLNGNVYLARSRADKPRARKSDVVPLNVDVVTPGLSSSAFLRFDDNTWVEVGGNSSFRETHGAKSPGGRRVLLNFGTLLSHIEKQPADRPMVFATPNAEATILGTTVRLSVSHDAKAGTTLEVKEGKVLLTRLLDKKSVEVVAGQFAVAAATGSDLVPHKSFPNEVLVKFGPADIAVKPGWVLDSGAEFDAARGYGWVGKGGESTGLYWVNPSNGVKEERKTGRFTARRVPAASGADPLKTTDVVAGWAGHSEVWRMPVPNGRYLVSVCCGDISFEQGPHHVAIEGIQVIDQKKNRAGQFVEVHDVPVEVKDGELTMIVGGNPGPRKSSDGSTDTILNYLIIKRIDPRKK